MGGLHRRVFPSTRSSEANLVRMYVFIVFVPPGRAATELVNNCLDVVSVGDYDIARV